MRCIHQEILGNGFCPDCERYIQSGQNLSVDKGCMTHMDGDDCCKFNQDMVVILKSDKERLDRIEAVWQKYSYMDEVICDAKLVEGFGIRGQIIYDLWQAIRREE